MIRYHFRNWIFLRVLFGKLLQGFRSPLDWTAMQLLSALFSLWSDASLNYLPVLNTHDLGSVSA
jgi:hypothetical protein